MQEMSMRKKWGLAPFFVPFVEVVFFFQKSSLSPFSQNQFLQGLDLSSPHFENKIAIDYN
jgi:hypothetical protein